MRADSRQGGKVILSIVCILSVSAFLAGASDHRADRFEDGTQKAITFGDVAVNTAALDHPDARRVMSISRNGIPFLMLYENHSGETDRFAIVNGRHGVLALGELAVEGIAAFAVHGNSIEGRPETPVLLLEASQAPGQWDTVTYAATKPRQGTDYYPMRGETYDDIDFDGQFDAKRVYNKKHEIVSMSIYLDGACKEICRVNDAGLFLKVGKYYPKQCDAFYTEGELRTHYRFQRGVGWKIHRTDRSSDGWQVDRNHAVDGKTLLDDITRIKAEQRGELTRFPSQSSD
jgi:hypothetical protein